MSVPLRLPPSERDFEIFFAVAFHSVSTRRAAEFHRISQTRVRQLVALVADWVADNLPDWGEADLKKQVRLAQHVAANRLEHQYEQAMSYWNAEGDPKYLRQASRIALAQARLGIVAGRIHALAADVTAGPLTDSVGCISAAQCTIPPTTDTDRLTAAPTRRDTPNHSPLPSENCQLKTENSSSPPPVDCSPQAAKHANAGPAADDDPALIDSPASLIEQERRQRQDDVEAAALMERRLLTLIENQGSANPDKVAQLQSTLARVRASKATAELRLSRFTPGIHIEPLDAPPQPSNANENVKEAAMT